MATFWNVSNHPSEKWGETQREAALAMLWGDCGKAIRDIAHPAIDPMATTEEVRESAFLVANQIKQNANHLDCAMVMGEPTFCHFLVAELIKAGITVVVATTRREVTESVVNGVPMKNAAFRFAQFRTLG